MMKYGIEISYSWGEKEDEPYGEFESPEEAYRKMCQMAAKEAYVQGEDFLPEQKCSVFFYPYEKQINLLYRYDNAWCYYRVIVINEEEKNAN